ncbi:MAG: Holliday junction branch migration protein RuvA [Minisyncoccia bacterium]
MIGFIEGKIIEKRGGRVIISANGVGYLVSVPLFVADKLTDGSNTGLYTYLAVRENALDLYGFLEASDKALFELLLTVSGIGPKTALGVMNTASGTQIEKAVVEQNPSYLTKVAGVGKKISEKIVLELKGKMLATSKDNFLGDVDGDVVEALVSLGYSQKQARDAVRDLPKDVEGANDKIKFALKNLNPKK